MALKINWTLSIQVPGGPKISDSRVLEVDAYDLIELTVDDGAVDQEVGLQPGSAGVKMLVIRSDQYGDKLTYKVNDGAASSGEVALDGPHLLFSQATIALLGKVPVKALFSNTIGKPAAIQILVGRDAPKPTPTPVPPSTPASAPTPTAKPTATPTRRTTPKAIH